MSHAIKDYDFTFYYVVVVGFSRIEGGERVRLLLQRASLKIQRETVDIWRSDNYPGRGSTLGIRLDMDKKQFIEVGLSQKGREHKQAFE